MTAPKSSTALHAAAAQGEETFITLLRVADRIQRDFMTLLREQADLTMVQYNVLRILRGAGPEGQTCCGIGDRLITHDPDVTRLVDRMERRDLVERGRDSNDRRIVRVHLTEAGRELVDRLDEPVQTFHKTRYKQLHVQQLRDLCALLNQIGEEKPR